MVTKEILDKYKDLPRDAILPLVSQQKYNIAIKKILKHAVIPFCKKGLCRQ